MIVVMSGASICFAILDVYCMINGFLSVASGLAGLLGITGLLLAVIKHATKSGQNLSKVQRAYLRMFAMGIALLLVGIILCAVSLHKEGITQYCALLAVMAGVGCSITIDGAIGLRHLLRRKENEKEISS